MAVALASNAAQIRGLVQHEAYREVFPELALASEASHHWETTAGGVMYATGAGGTITATAARAVDEAGTFDASSAGNMDISATFAVVNLGSGDSLQLTMKKVFG